MSDGKTHTAVGIIAGGAAGAISARNERIEHAVAEFVGAVIGGALGGKVLDVVEPATTPRHRDVAHSLTANALLAIGVREWVPQSVEWLRGRANEVEQLAAKQTNQLMRVALEIGAVLIRVLAGVVVGVVAGHFSHAALDLTTPMGLPLLGAGGPSLSLAR